MRHDDVLRRKRLTVEDLQDITFPVGYVSYLAVTFFLYHHAVMRAQIIVLSGDISRRRVKST